MVGGKLLVAPFVPYWCNDTDFRLGQGHGRQKMTLTLTEFCGIKVVT